MEGCETAGGPSFGAREGSEEFSRIANNSKDEFLGTVSHELQNRLRRIFIHFSALFPPGSRSLRGCLERADLRLTARG